MLLHIEILTNTTTNEHIQHGTAWQIQWKHAQLRVGIGTSSTPGAWLLQSTEFSYRFLGATRVKEYRQRRSWRQNERAVEQGTLDGESPPAPAPEPEDESGD